MYANYEKDSGYKSGRAKTTVGLHTSRGFISDVKAPVIPVLTTSREFNEKSNKIAVVVAGILISVIVAFFFLLQYAGYIG